MSKTKSGLFLGTVPSQEIDFKNSTTKPENTKGIGFQNFSILEPIMLETKLSF